MPTIIPTSFFWIWFAILVAIMLTIDLFLVKTSGGKRSMKANIMWSAIWIWVALIFNATIFFLYHPPVNHQLAIEFLTAYLVEKSLSVDNLFVFLMIFAGMQTREEHRPKILKWGILTAIVMRVIFIFAGVELLNQFKFVVYIFGAILLWAAYKMIWWKEESASDVASHPTILWMKKYFRLVSDHTGDKFLIKKGELLHITPLFITLVLIELSDLVFAIDSIPAVIAISRDPFIVVTSNVFAILWLRALYFVVADMVSKFIYLKQGVGTILFYVGIKMMISEFVHIPTSISLGVIAFCLCVSIFASWKKQVLVPEKIKD